tara:strand:- start:1029 stop:1190 length:162 start_codon:yes stop_codon:yes gene_type:complete
MDVQVVSIGISPSGEASLQSPTSLILLLAVIRTLHLLCLHLLHPVSDGLSFHS